MGVKFEYYQSNIVLDNINDFKLFFLQRKNSLSFFIIEQSSKQIVSFNNLALDANLADTIEQYLEEDQVLGRFSTIESLGVHVNAISLIPNRLFNTHTLSTYFKDVFEVDHMHINYADLSDQQTKLVYAYSKSTINALEPYFKIGHIQPAFLGPINSLLLQKEISSFLIQMDEGLFYLSYIDQGEIKFLNQFSFDSSADLLYYVLKVASLLKLDTNQLNIKLTGAVEEESEVYKTLHRFVHSLSFLEEEGTTNIPFSMSEKRYFSDIFAFLK